MTSFQDAKQSEKIAILEIETERRGWAPNYRQFHSAKLYVGNDVHCIYNVLKGKEKARLMNHLLDHRPEFSYRSGERILRFRTKSEAREAVLDFLLDNYPRTKLLLDGSHMNPDPQKVIWASTPRVKQNLCSLYKRAKRIGFGQAPSDFQEMKEIRWEWYKIIGEDLC